MFNSFFSVLLILSNKKQKMQQMTRTEGNAASNTMQGLRIVSERENIQRKWETHACVWEILFGVNAHKRTSVLKLHFAKVNRH